MYDLAILGAKLLDGSGAPAVEADLAVADGRIVRIGDVAAASAQHVVCADGLILAPGFIDSHTHDDGYLIAHPDMTPKVSQGVTTVVTGNCGISLAPLVRDAVPQPLDLLGPGALFRYPRLSDWREAVEAARPAANAVPLVGHTTLRVAAMADTARPADDAEIGRMRALLDAAMDDGGFGISTGTFYPPASAAPPEEVIAVCAPLKGRKAVFATHLRDEADAIVPAMEEALATARSCGATLVFSHHKLAGSANHGRSRETLALIEQAAGDMPVCLDCHPYPATSTMLRLDRARLASRTLITWSEGYPQAAGRDFAEVCAELGLDDAAAVERLKPAGAIYFLMDEADVQRIFAYPRTMVGSDGLPFDPHPHPRQWGTFPRVLGAFVRERGVLGLAEAVHRMTGLAAANYGLSERGLLREGYWADLVLFDAAAIADRATFADPKQISAGISGVWVNGEPVWNGAAAVNKGRPRGRVLRPAQ